MTITSTSILKKLSLIMLVFAALILAREFLVPLSIAVVIATLFIPMCKWFESRGIPKGISVLICFVVLLTVITGIISLLGMQISALSGDLELIQERISDMYDHIREFIFLNLGISYEKQIQMLSERQSSLTDLFTKIAGSMATMITDMVLILAYVFLILFYREHISRSLLKLASPDQKKEMENLVNNAARVSQQYLLGLTKMIACLWIMYSIGFSILGVKHAVFFAILCGLLEIVPFIGNITGTTLTVLAAFVQGASYPVLGGIVVTYAIVQFIQGWFLEPLIVGHHVRINPLFTIIALVVGELVWGISGVFLAIPLTAMIKIVCDHIEPLKPYGYLIGETQSEQKGESFSKRLLSKFLKRNKIT